MIIGVVCACVCSCVHVCVYGGWGGGGGGRDVSLVVNVDSTVCLYDCTRKTCCATTEY